MCFVKNQSSHVSAELVTVMFAEYLLIYLFYHCSWFLIVYLVALAHIFKYKNAIFCFSFSQICLYTMIRVWSLPLWIICDEKLEQVIMLLWFGGIEAKPDKNRFNDGTIFSSEVCNAFLQLMMRMRMMWWWWWFFEAIVSFHSQNVR